MESSTENAPGFDPHAEVARMLESNPEAVIWDGDMLVV